MALLVDRNNLVNGLPVWPDSSHGREPYVTTPTVRQLSLLEQAINACSYDWNRLRRIGLGNTSVLFHWVNDAYLFAGHIGTVQMVKAPLITAPDGSAQYPAFAPVTRPHGKPPGQLGDYGGVVMLGSQTDVYLLNTLDQDAPPYGGPRFYMETVIRLLGLVTTYQSFRRAASQRDRLARCFAPADRADFDLPVTRSGDPLIVPPGTPGAVQDTEPGSPSYGTWFLQNATDVDQTMLGTSQWFFESSGIEYRQGPDYVLDWGHEDSPVPAPAPWETRLLEAAAETFKDIFTTSQFRRLRNRTAVKLKPGRAAFDQFVSLYMDEIPPPPDPSGVYNYGARAYSEFLYAFIPPSPGHPDGEKRLIGYRYNESWIQYDIPKNLGDDHSIVTLEVLPGHGGQSGKNFNWTTELIWSGTGSGSRPDRLTTAGAPVSRVLPLRVQIPATNFTDTQLFWTIEGLYGGPDPMIAGEEFTYAIDSNRQDVLFETMAGLSGISPVQVLQWFKYRALLPTGAHPRYPAGRLHADGADAGARRNGRSRVGTDTSAQDTGAPPLRPPAGGSPEHRYASPSRYGDQGVAKT